MPKLKMPTLLEFSRLVTKIADQIAEDFTKPTDDFHPVMVALPGDGSDFRVFGLPGELLQNGAAGKDVLAHRVMVPIIDAVGAKMISWTMSAWSLELQGKSEADAREAVRRAQENGLANHPDRVERVLINIIDSHAMETWTAQIHRTAIAPPTLGPWEDYIKSLKSRNPTADAKPVIEGRFVDPLQAALRDSSGRPDAKKLRALGVL